MSVEHLATEDMPEYLAAAGSVHRDVRTTDEEPAREMHERLPGKVRSSSPPVAAPDEMPPAVILAAGQGSRLCSEVDPPKPLMKLMGLTLLERSIRTALSAGVPRIVVVIGHRGHEVASHVRSLAPRAGVPLRIVESRAWQLGNGASALASERDVDGRFFVLMGDHVYPQEFLRRLVADDDGRRAVALVVDSNVDTVPDLAEATKVRLAGRRITALGKELTSFDGADTGVFLCRPALFDALREAKARGRHTFGDAVQLLAARGEASSSSANGLLWQDIDTPEDLALARRRLGRRSIERVHQRRSAHAHGEVARPPDGSA